MISRVVGVVNCVCVCVRARARSRCMHCIALRCTRTDLHVVYVPLLLQVVRSYGRSLALNTSVSITIVVRPQRKYVRPCRLGVV